MKSISPIILFTYRRVPKETIESLLQNELASQSKLFIYSDGYKNDIDKSDVLTVRDYLKTITGFKSIEIIEASNNKGLATSIIGGVTEIIDGYEKVIVLEDDLIVSTDFLEYMNEALEFYKNDSKIWSISGYSPKLPCLEDYSKDVYLSSRGSSWGWATWKDRWDSVDWDVKEFNILKNKRDEFELGGNDMYKMLTLQVFGKIDSWYIRSAFSAFLQSKYTIYPSKSKVINNGFDDNLGIHNSGNGNKWKTTLNNNEIKLHNLELDTEIANCFKKYHDLGIVTQVGYFLKRNGGYNFGKRILKMIRKVI